MASIGMKVRAVKPADVPILCDLLNEIIALGGTTAFETPMSVPVFLDYFFKSQIQISFLVAENETGDLLGFQVLSAHEKLPEDWADIATFAAVNSRNAGIAAALFAETLALARTFEIEFINATIRADNLGGLGYYDRMGFVTYRIERNVPLKSGRRVDRVSKQYAVAGEPAANGA